MSQYNVRAVYDALHFGCPAGEFPMDINFSVPSSKSITCKALVMAAFADGKSTITHLAKGLDIDLLVENLVSLGIQITLDEKKKTAEILGCKGLLPKKTGEIKLDNNDISSTMLLALLAFSDCEYKVSGEKISSCLSDIIQILSSLGADVKLVEEKDSFTVFIQGNSDNLSSVTFDENVSGIVASALYIAAANSKKSISVTNNEGKDISDSDMTIALMEKFKVVPGADEESVLVFGKDSGFSGIDYSVEPDMTLASYIYALCPILGVPSSVNRIAGESIQGDFEFINILYQLGCDVNIANNLLTIYPPDDNTLIGIVINIEACPRQAALVSVLASLANRPSMIVGLSALRSDKRDIAEDIVNELNKVSIKAELAKMPLENGSTIDAISVFPSLSSNGIVETHGNPDLAVAFTLLGLKNGGITIDSTDSLTPVFPQFFEAIDALTSQILD